jgi:hypothetical protein
MKNGRRRPSCDGTSRMTRECQVRICERLGVKYPGPTRQSLPMHSAPVPTNVRYAPNSDQIGEMPRTTLIARSGLMHRSKVGEIQRDNSAVGRHDAGG